MLKRPPQNRVDAPIIFVHPDDPAWDKARIAAEQAEMKKRGEKPQDHPAARYQGGWNRYDLDAQGTVAGELKSPRDYIDETKQPTMWRLRRLTALEWYEVHPLWLKGRKNGEDAPVAACLLACVMGLEKADNGPDLDRPGGRLGNADIQRLHDWGQESEIDLVLAIGEAVYCASMPLTESEGKR